ncbi:FAD/NAD(P)-binding domain-containing protein [Favolaschia claudopus]|uniref:FAD/NAD(P)-binding domain-containing protein n=1 Tax=Favolaschia claudopus TaxID=2862362 RepID=A0AAW0D727_9AGAR
MAQKPILISGGGLSALLIAQSLRRHNIPFQIYERDASFDIRGNGYRLRLSSEGLDAIESVLTPEHFQRFYDKCGKTGGTGFTAYDAISGAQTEHRDATEVATLASRGGKVVGIARGEMRRIFYEGCEEHTHWGKNVIKYELTPDGVQLVFSDGTKSPEGSMLICADGVHSKLAKQLSDGKLKVYDTGARGIHGQAYTTAFKELGEGVFTFRDTSRPEGDLFVITNVRSQDMDDPTIQFGWTLAAPGAVVQAPNNDYTIVGKQAADLAKSLTANWGPRFKPLFDQMVESEAAFWKITCSSPNGVPEWTNQPRVTVVGDSVHSMTPAGGIGANTAVQDCALLGRLIGEAGGYKEGITAAYEKEMRVYGGAAVKRSYESARASMGIGELVDTI